jgi:hypothetical protein
MRRLTYEEVHELSVLLREARLTAQRRREIGARGCYIERDVVRYVRTVLAECTRPGI